MPHQLNTLAESDPYRDLWEAVSGLRNYGEAWCQPEDGAPYPENLNISTMYTPDRYGKERPQPWQEGDEHRYWERVRITAGTSHEHPFITTDPISFSIGDQLVIPEAYPEVSRVITADVAKNSTPTLTVSTTAELYREPRDQRDRYLGTPIGRLFVKDTLLLDSDDGTGYRDTRASLSGALDKDRNPTSLRLPSSDDPLRTKVQGQALRRASIDSVRSTYSPKTLTTLAETITGLVAKYGRHPQSSYEEPRDAVFGARG